MHELREAVLAILIGERGVASSEFDGSGRRRSWSEKRTLRTRERETLLEWKGVWYRSHCESASCETEIGYERKRQCNAIKYSYYRGRVPEGEDIDAFIGKFYYNNDELIIEGQVLVLLKVALVEVEGAWPLCSILGVCAMADGLMCCVFSIGGYHPVHSAGTQCVLAQWVIRRRRGGEHFVSILGLARIVVT